MTSNFLIKFAKKASKKKHLGALLVVSFFAYFGIANAMQSNFEETPIEINANISQPTQTPTPEPTATFQPLKNNGEVYPTQTSSPTPTSGENDELSNVSGTGDFESEPFNINLEVIGLVDGDENCRETKVTSNKIVTDYTYIVEGGSNGGGHPNNNSFIFGLCKHPKTYEYHLTLYSSDGGKKELIQYFSMWPTADSFPTPAPSPVPEHDEFTGNWQTTNTNEGKVVTITTNLNLKRCNIETYWSKTTGPNTVSSQGDHDGVINNNICTFVATNVDTRIVHAEVESIYGEVIAFSNSFNDHSPEIIQ